MKVSYIIATIASVAIAAPFPQLPAVPGLGAVSGLVAPVTSLLSPVTSLTGGLVPGVKRQLPAVSGLLSPVTSLTSGLTGSLPLKRSEGVPGYEDHEKRSKGVPGYDDHSSS